MLRKLLAAALLPLVILCACGKPAETTPADENREIQPPLIGVAVPAEGGEYAGYRSAVEAAGGRTVLIPMLDNEADLEAFIGTLDGVLIPGGADIPPDIYGEEAHPSVHLLDRARAEYLIDVAQLAMNGETPSRPSGRLSRSPGTAVFGICLGQQVMNVARGGTLIQDIPSEVTGALIHRGDGAGHEVSVVEGSHLAAIVGTQLEVDSSHHQAVEQLGNGLVVTARSADGVIEGIELADGGRTGERFVVGVQWHPERILDQPGQRALFAAFVEACGRRN